MHSSARVRPLSPLVPLLLGGLLMACGSDGEGTTPSSSLPSAPSSDPSQVDPTDPSRVDPTDPSRVDPTDPSQVDPTDPSRVDPTDPSRVDPTDPSQVDPTDPSQVDPTDPSQTVDEVVVAVEGVVVDAEGYGLSGVLITVDGVSAATTGVDGTFEVEVLAAPGEATGLTFSREGFVSDHKPIILDEDAAMTLPVVLHRRGAVQVMANAEDGGTFTGALGGRVTFPPDAIADADGNPVSGPVAFTITPVDFGAPVGGAAFPGSAAAMQADGSATDLESFGVMDITFVDDGRGLRLADGVTATIEIPLTAGELSTGDTTPLWSLDPESGLWIEDGEGEVIRRGGSNYLRGEVSHFSWWNCDIGVDGIEVILEVRLPDGEPFEGDLSVRLAFSARSGIFQPRLPRLRGATEHRLLFPLEREVMVQVDAIGQLGQGSKTTTVERGDGGTPRVIVVFDAASMDPESWVAIPTDEPLVLSLEEGESVYLTAQPQPDDPRIIGVAATEGLSVSIAPYRNVPGVVARRMTSGDETVYGVFPGDASLAAVWRVDALADGVLRAEDNMGNMELDTVERVTLGGGTPVERLAFLRAGQWVRIGATVVDPESSTQPTASFAGGFTSGDGNLRIEDVRRVGRTGFYPLRFDGFGGDDEVDIILRELDPPALVPFSPATPGIRVVSQPGFGGGQLFELPVAPGGAVEAWASSADPEHGIVMGSLWVHRGESGSGGINLRGPSGQSSLVPRSESGGATDVPATRETDHTLVVFVGPDQRFDPDAAEFEIVVSTWDGTRLDDVVVGDPDTPGCAPDALSSLAVTYVLDEGGTFTFCPGRHALRDGEFRRDALHIEGAGRDETTLHLWDRAAIEDGRGSFARGDVQDWTFRDFTLEGENLRVGNEPQALIELRSREAGSLLVERVDFVDRRGPTEDDPNRTGGSGINFAENTPGTLDVTVRDSSFVNMNTAIRAFSANTFLGEGLIARHTRNGLRASDVLEFTVRDSDLEVFTEGIRHDAGRALRSHYENNLVVRTQGVASGYCLTALYRELDDFAVDADDPRTIVRDNTCILNTGGGIWLLSGAGRGALVEGNRIVPEDGVEFLQSEGVRMQRSGGSSDDGPSGPVRIVNNIFLDHRQTGGVIAVWGAENHGPIEIVNNTLTLATGIGSGRSRAIDFALPNDASGPFPFTVLNNLVIGSGDARDDGITLTTADASIVSEGNVFSNIRRSHAVRGSGDALPGYGADNTTVEGTIPVDGDGRPDSNAASVDAGVDRDEVPDTDIDGAPRPQGEGVDAGAHEQ